VKPLYVYRLNDRTLLFASEVTALLASGLVPRRLYAPAIDSYLAWGCVPSRWSLIEGVECVQPGERWCFDLGGQHETLKPHREYYWRPPFHRTSRKALTRGEAIEQLRPVICKAFELRMVSDVPVGVFLSGGIDSSEIVATLATLGYKLHTFSMVFGERLYDESDHSRAVARRFSSEHTELILKPDDVLENFEHALAAYDQPSIDGLNTYFIARSTRAAGVKVAISGLGGDELFAGYSYFRYTQQLNRPAYRIAARLAHLMLRRIAPQQMRTLKLGAMLQAMGSPLRQYQVCREVMPVNRRRSLYRGHEMTRYALANETAEHLQHQIRGLDPVNAYSLLEIAIYLGGMLLRDTDQMSMANSLEVREPLLDHVLVETVARMPGDMKLQAGEHSPTKGLLVDSLPIDLPDQVANRPKMGFVFPWEDWLRGDLRHRIEATLMDRHAVAAAGLNPQGIEDIWQGYLTHRPGLRYTDILSLLNLLEWVRRHRLVLEDHS
jgi:asparagine synthase (glutamine-hydrolysing)